MEKEVDVEKWEQVEWVANEWAKEWAVERQRLVQMEDERRRLEKWNVCVESCEIHFENFDHVKERMLHDEHLCLLKENMEDYV